MRLDAPGAPHLGYCTNIHAGESWPEVRANVATHVRAVKARVAPDRPFGVGLRLSAAAAETLDDPDELAVFRSLLADAGLYVFTVNGFPYGRFSGSRVKEAVYRPDWLEPERLAYTNRLARLLAALLPPGCDGTISTVPGAFKPRVGAEADAAAIARAVAAHAAVLAELQERDGVTIRLALEPEPCCQLETVAETVAFFEQHLFRTAVAGCDARRGEAVLRRHVGVCFDTCHMAVEYEDPAEALATFAAHGIGVPKMQISAGLAATLASADDVDALRAFAEDVYLHQVVERRATGLVRWTDLPDALAAVARAPRTGDGAREWRIHFHVPIFRETLGRFRSTQPYLRDVLAAVRQTPSVPHLEVETYTWDVLPPEFRGEPIVDAIARELRWTIAELGGRSAP